MARRWIIRITALAVLAAAVCWWRCRAGGCSAAAVEAPLDTSLDATPEPAAQAVPTTGPAPAGVEAVGGTCPDGYPVKANGSSGIYHVPGGRFYERTVPTRCYATAADAEADGYRRAKA